MPEQHRGVAAERRAILVVLGTRPEVIKLSPVIRALSADDGFIVRVVSTGQHRELVDQACAALDVRVDSDLRLMQSRQQLSQLFADAMVGISEEIQASRPDCVVVQGDTSTTLAAALSSFYAGVPVAHVEAGLRSGDPLDPFPEEANRRMVTTLSTWHFAPTERSRQSLIDEGVDRSRIEMTGNTGIDSLFWVLASGRGQSAFRQSQRRVLVTLHRRENQASLIPAAGPQLRSLADSGYEVVIPLHPSPAVRDAVLPHIDNSGVRIVQPLDYPDFVRSMADADLVVTDSGGVQEEAPYLGTPVLVARRTTERQEAVDAGAAHLLGDDMSALAQLAAETIANDTGRAATGAAPFGDGHAASRIVDRLRQSLRPTAHTGRAA